VLEELHVKDLALIDEAWLELGAGMTVLTGETGAGKTVLVGALKLLLGERADATLVRSGATEALVEGRFTLDGRERFVRRRLTAEGRSKCYLDGEMATVTGLDDALGAGVDLHGQHEHQALLHPARHVGYLDRFIGALASDALAGYRDAWASAVRARQDAERLAAALRDRDSRMDALRWTIDEIDSVAPKPGEDIAIETRLPRMRHAEKLSEASVAAFNALRLDGGASDALGEALAALHAAGGLDPALDAMSDDLAVSIAAIDDAGARIREYGESIDYDLGALNDAEARLAALTSLRRKHGVTLDDVLAARDSAAAELDVLEAGEAGLEAAQEAVRTAEAALREAGGALGAVRAQAAPLFTEQLAAAASDLALPGAVFEVAFSPLDFDAWTADGPHKVEFLFSSSAGDPPRPLARIASGGEVSRVMLALKGALGAADTVSVLVFDEIDAGIGGATALAVGKRLAQLARGRQVLVITHLAQVAAYADAHLVVEKSEADGRAVTRVRPVTGEERVVEVARMLSGSDSDTGLAHARELLSTASTR
jgi:DNA repair protein RecN (Recombination protein N)